MATVMAIALVTVMAIDSDYAGDGVVERSRSTSSATMACKREKRNFFSSTSCFYYYYSLFLLLLPKLVQILYCNQTLCVYVCVYVLPRPKVGSKTSFGAICSFFLPKFRNLELHNL